MHHLFPNDFFFPFRIEVNWRYWLGKVFGMERNGMFAVNEQQQKNICSVPKWWYRENLFNFYKTWHFVSFLIRYLYNNLIWDLEENLMERERQTDTETERQWQKVLSSITKKHFHLKKRFQNDWHIRLQWFNPIDTHWQLNGYVWGEKEKLIEKFFPKGVKWECML